MKKTKIMVWSVAAMLMLAACGNKNTENPADMETAKTTETTEIAETAETTANTANTATGTVGLANPFVTCTTLEEAAQTAGFEMTVPDVLEGYEQIVIQAVKDQLIQVIWQSGDNKITIRKGTGAEDISGDYNQYPHTEEISVGDLQVTVKGSDEAVNTAVWTVGDYAYAISALNEGIERDAMSGLIGAVQ